MEQDLISDCLPRSFKDKEWLRRSDRQNCINFTGSNPLPMTGLTLYKASAGSGKTFKLTGEYLQLLFHNPGLYRHILAVTFTNKATGEMKQRILYELDRLASGKDSGYRQMLQQRFEMDDQQVQQQAGRVLHNILHDYSRFSVSTIDRFFQRILRTFARELGLQSGYTLETDHEEILNFVVDELLLATEKDEQLRNWLVEFGSSRMSEGKSWDFQEDILKLAGELMKEEVKDLRLADKEKAGNRDRLTHYVSKLKKERARFENHVQSLGRKAADAMAQNGLTIDDFDHKRTGVARYFQYLKNRDFVNDYEKLEAKTHTMKVLDDPEKWPASDADKHTKEQVISLARNTLNDLLNEALAYIDNHRRHYITVREILKNVYVLGLLVDIQQRVARYCREKNVFLIADAGEFLRRIIGNNDAPFIYEKAGSTYQHFMIDEFQDTSHFQWDNFKPLISDSLAQNRYNLLVGDVKQSIYRWRNSDWKILQDDVYHEFASALNSQALEYNWRSRENIVAYNNTFFHDAPVMLQNHYDGEVSQQGIDNPYSNKLREAYRDVLQKMPRDHEGGQVVTRFFPHQDKKQSEAREKALEQLITDIEKMQDQGYPLSDMAVMVRTHAEGQQVADALTGKQKEAGGPKAYRYDFISNDALYVMRAESVKLLCALFRHLVAPDDPVNQAFIRDTYRRVFLGEEPDGQQQHELFKHRGNTLAGSLPEAFTEHQEELRRMPLYELTERLIYIFNIHDLPGEIPYLQAFQETVLDYSRRYASDLNSFLEWWDDHAHKKMLQLPEDYDAIRILTIHKSKGLEYKVVLIPFCNWELSFSASGGKKKYLWCTPGQSPLDEVEVVPVEYNKNIAATHFYQEYFSEKFHQYVDKLNMLYVAFTRAEEVLITYAPIKTGADGEPTYRKKDKAITQMGDLIHAVYEKQDHFSRPGDPSAPFWDSLGDHWDPESMVFSRGEIPGDTDEEQSAENRLLQETYPVYSSKPRLHLRYEHEEFFSEHTDLFRGTVDYGRIMHQVFEYIHTLDDVEPALDRVYLDGKISSSERSRLQKDILQSIRQSGVEEWFSGSWRIFNEKEILLPGGRSHRPDRVMFKDGQTVVLDYKFGEREEDSYRRKMRRYLKELSNMGYNNAVGYIWYINQEKLTKVT